MRLAPRLVLAFGFVATLSVTGLGYFVRRDRRESETGRFEHEVSRACDRVIAEIGRQGESDRKLIAGACQSGELVDRALIALESGTLTDERRLALSRLVPEERLAFDLDELILATGQGDLLGQDPIVAGDLRRGPLANIVADDRASFALMSWPEPVLESHCRKRASNGDAIALAGWRRLGPVAERLGKTLDVHVALGAETPHGSDVAEARCTLSDASGASLAVFVDKPKTELVDNLIRIDHTILYAALMSTGLALVLGVLLARSLGRPIADLAAEARKVARGEARPLAVRGPGEIAELAQAFDTMLTDLEGTRRRLAATARLAAWREAARRVAHEIKNPLAPIRAAVETLRRLRARNDPEFDAYFDEATRTVLAEVHRIAAIVTEFTRFARLPQPRPARVDLGDIARQVVRLHESPEGTRLVLTVATDVPAITADADQVVQVLTNLIQNAIDAAPKPGGEVRIAVTGEGGTLAALTVSDNGPGIAPHVAARLFEPYVTTKEHGTGLGLAIAQRIAIEHGGELSCIHTAVGGGATFRLSLPVEGPRPADDESEGAQRPV